MSSLPSFLAAASGPRGPSHDQRAACLAALAGRVPLAVALGVGRLPVTPRPPPPPPGRPVPP
ncbi:hypothetical protein DIJ60_26985, partial [Burkholderia pseudomallei]